MVVIDVWHFDLLPRDTSLPLGAKRTQDLSFALVRGSQQDSGHVVTSHPWGGTGVPSAWGRGQLVQESLPLPYPAWEALLR